MLYHYKDENHISLLNSKTLISVFIIITSFFSIMMLFPHSFLWITGSLLDSAPCTHVVPVVRTDCEGAAVDVVALVLVLAVRVKPVVPEAGTATPVVVFSWSPNPTSNSVHVSVGCFQVASTKVANNTPTYLLL
jgi:hypothetical protein